MAHSIAFLLPFSEADLDYYAEQGFYALAITQEMIVRRSLNNHIDHVKEDLIEQIHERGMKFVVYTLRNEFVYYAFDYGQDPYAEFQHYLDLGTDMIFTDFPGSLCQFYKYKGLIL